YFCSMQKNPNEQVASAWLLSFLLEKRFRLYRHLLVLLAVATALYNNTMVISEPLATYVKSGLFLWLVAMFYSNMYWLVPKFLFPARYLQFALGVVMYIVIAYGIVTCIKSILHPQLLRYNGHITDGPRILPFVVLIVSLVTASTCIKLFQRWVLDTQRINELERMTMQAELEQLKNQINPHFLFNMLNNATVLAQKDPAKASQVLMKLSDFLRYQLYDSARASVLLTADMHFLNDLLNLEKIRRDHFRFSISREGALNGVMVAPLLFVTFVENAVKHSLDMDGTSWVELYFSIRTGVLQFKCVNSKPAHAGAQKEEGGLGLSNVKRRLALLYPERHTLRVAAEPHQYTVDLTIRL
ncbi:MAG TPA: histidine kinase, partial [Chitinophaga sp.]